MEKEITTKIELGFDGVFTLNIVPKIGLSIKPLEASTISEINKPKNLQISFPIKAQHQNIKNGQLCKLNWLFKRAGADKLEVGPPINCQIMVDDPHSCRVVDSKGEVLVLDIAKDNLIGSGYLGFRIDIDFPHTDPVIFEPSIVFSNTIGLETIKNGSLLIGSQVSFTPKYDSVFDRGIIELHITESDEGVVDNPSGYVTTHQWADGDNDSWHWRVGFIDDKGSKLAYTGSEDNKDFKYLVQLKVSTDQGGTFYPVYRDENTLVGIKKPVLTHFKCSEYSSLVLFTSTKVEGKIENIDTDVGFAIELALAQYNPKSVIIDDYENLQWQSVSLQKDGSFSENLSTKFGSLSDNASTFVNLVGLLRIPESSLLHTSSYAYHIHDSLEYDESLNAGVHGGKAAGISSATNICTEFEALTKEVMRNRIDYKEFYASKGKEYRHDQVKSYSHYYDPIDYSNHRYAGNTRRAGDAPDSVQRKAIDTLFALAKENNFPNRDICLLLAIAYVESGFNPDAAAGTTRAAGLGQFIIDPKRADIWKKEYGLTKDNVFDLETNAKALIIAFQKYAKNASKFTGEERSIHIYWEHHDGPKLGGDGGNIAKNDVLPIADKFYKHINW